MMIMRILCVAFKLFMMVLWCHVAKRGKNSNKTEFNTYWCSIFFYTIFGVLIIIMAKTISLQRLRSNKMLCASERIKLPKEETSRIEMLEKRQAKCRPRAWLSRLMSWRTLTSNNTHRYTRIHTLLHICFKRLNWVSGTSQLRQPLTALPPSQYPLACHALLLPGFCHLLFLSVCNSCIGGQDMALLIANRIMHFFVAPPFMRHQSYDAYAIHTLNQRCFYPRTNLIYWLQLASQKGQS